MVHMFLAENQSINKIFDCYHDYILLLKRWFVFSNLTFFYINKKLLTFLGQLINSDQY